MGRFSFRRNSRGDCLRDKHKLQQIKEGTEQRPGRCFIRADLLCQRKRLDESENEPTRGILDTPVDVEASSVVSSALSDFKFKDYDWDGKPGAKRKPSLVRSSQSDPLKRSDAQEFQESSDEVGERLVRNMSLFRGRSRRERTPASLSEQASFVHLVVSDMKEGNLAVSDMKEGPSEASDIIVDLQGEGEQRVGGIEPVLSSIHASFSDIVFPGESTPKHALPKKPILRSSSCVLQEDEEARRERLRKEVSLFSAEGDDETEASVSLIPDVVVHHHHSTTYHHFPVRDSQTNIGTNDPESVGNDENTLATKSTKLSSKTSLDSDEGGIDRFDGMCSSFSLSDGFKSVVLLLQQTDKKCDEIVSASK